GTFGEKKWDNSSTATSNNDLVQRASGAVHCNSSYFGASVGTKIYLYDVVGNNKYSIGITGSQLNYTTYST
ncbi:unnamed protein product, partial [marine sediment metagenome]